jgi:hypothetical protein
MRSKNNPAIEYFLSPLACEPVEGNKAVFLQSITLYVRRGEGGGNLPHPTLHRQDVSV